MQGAAYVRSSSAKVWHLKDHPDGGGIETAGRRYGDNTVDGALLFSSLLFQILIAAAIHQFTGDIFVCMINLILSPLLYPL